MYRVMTVHSPVHEGLDGGVWNSLISENLAHYSLSLKFSLKKIPYSLKS